MFKLRLQKTTLFLTLLFSILLSQQSAWGLVAEELLLVTNKNVPASLELAKLYQQKRQVPTGNLVQLDLPKAEVISRKDYQQKLLRPLREFLQHDRSAVPTRCIVLFYGVPLRVFPPELSQEDWRKSEALKFKQKEIDWLLKNSTAGAPELGELRQQRETLSQQIADLSSRGQGAAVDSEVALLQVENYPLENWLPNPFFVGFQASKEALPLKKDEVLLVARLDGPTPGIVRRMIDDSLWAEQVGLQGHAYFDARWPLPKEKDLQGYALYDASLHKSAELTAESSSLPVTLDQQERLFQPGEAPEAALYAGWYSLAQYVDAFDWQAGAVAYHIASAECTTLKKAGSRVWCKRLLEDGVAATIGPVAEPYVQGFPLPEVFFRYLLDGYYSLAESYFLSTPFLSWQMLLIGDPLYRPFRNRLN